MPENYRPLASELVPARPAALWFFLPCVPPTATHQAKRIARRGAFYGLTDKPELVAARHSLEELLGPHRPAQAFRGPVCLALTFTWPWPKSTSQRDRRRGRRPKVTRPDCSNLAKTLEDRLVFLRFLEDDCQVVELVVAKFVGDAPGITVHLAPWPTSSVVPLVVLAAVTSA